MRKSKSASAAKLVYLAVATLPIAISGFGIANAQEEKKDPQTVCKDAGFEFIVTADPAKLYSRDFGGPFKTNGQTLPKDTCLNGSRKPLKAEDANYYQITEYQKPESEEREWGDYDFYKSGDAKLIK
jgi:hypothetical protein